jgi:hypothetical protein
VLLWIKFQLMPRMEGFEIYNTLRCIIDHVEHKRMAACLCGAPWQALEMSRVYKCQV